jgi:AcrR family transcriptional regulator
VRRKVRYAHAFAAMLALSMAKRPRTPRPVKNKNNSGKHREQSFNLMWGLRERPSRGPKPELSLDAIIRAAIGIVDTESLSALTMNRVATELDVTTMALYRHVPGKDELIDLMIDVALGTPPDPGGRDWRTEIVGWARASLGLFQARPWLLESVMRRAPIGPNWVAWLDAALQALSDSGLTAREMVPTVLLIDGHVRSAAQISLGATGTGEWAENFGRMLQRVSVDPRYAALASVAGGGGFAQSGQSSFEFGLQRILDGVESFMRTPASRRSRSAAGRRVIASGAPRVRRMGPKR